MTLLYLYLKTTLITISLLSTLLRGLRVRRCVVVERLFRVGTSKGFDSSPQVLPYQCAEWSLLLTEPLHTTSCTTPPLFLLQYTFWTSTRESWRFLRSPEGQSTGSIPLYGLLLFEDNVHNCVSFG